MKRKGVPKAHFEVRRELYFWPVPSATEAGGSSFTVLYLSDLHLNHRSESGIATLLQTIETLNPNIVLLGGDYVDTRTGLPHLQTLLNGLAGRQHVFAVAGNHDIFFGQEALQKMFEAVGITWLHKSPFYLYLNGTKIKISPAFKHVATEPEDLFSILVLHKPAPLKKFQHHFHLAFAGHLHGCQVVLWKRGEHLFPGRLFYRWNRLHAAGGACRYYISKGLGDTLPLRFNCPKDIILVTVKSQSIPYENAFRY